MKKEGIALWSNASVVAKGKGLQELNGIPTWQGRPWARLLVGVLQVQGSGFPEARVFGSSF